MRITLFSIFVLFSINVLSQNLILNSSFDDVNYCTEYNQPCSPEAWRLTSSNLPLYQEQVNNNFVGIIIYNSSAQNVRSYLQARLSDTLIIGEKYMFSMDIKPNDLLINEIGVLFSDTLIHTRSDALLNINPTIEFVNNEKLLQFKKSNGWLHLEKELTSNNKCLFIIIGNFYPDNRIVKKKLKGKIEPFRNFYYSIDNVKLVSLNNLHKEENICKIKNIIYELHFRHPVSDTLFSLKKKILVKQNKLSEVNIPNIIDTFSLYSDFLFLFDSYEPSKYFIAKVDSIFKNLKHPIDSIIVIGNTDNIGSDIYNNKLSFKRAEMVAKHITEIISIPKDNLIFFGVGSRFPLFTNPTSTERYKNRRVEIIIKYKKVK